MLRFLTRFIRTIAVDFRTSIGLPLSPSIAWCVSLLLFILLLFFFFLFRGENKQSHENRKNKGKYKLENILSYYDVENSNDEENRLLVN